MNMKTTTRTTTTTTKYNAFKEAKGGEQSVQRFGVFQKCANDINNKPLSNEQTRFRSVNHKGFKVKNNKIAMHDGDDK